MLNHYRWADEDHNLAWTMAVVEGRSEDDVIRAYGGDPAQPAGVMPFAAVLDLIPEEDIGKYFYMQTICHDRYVIVIENNGWAGQDRKLACHVSKNNGRFFSVYWSPTHTRIVQAADGTLIADFDPLFIGVPAGMNDMYPDWINRVVFTTEMLQSAMLEAMEQQTGLTFDEQWLQESLPTYRIPDPHWILKDLENADQP